MAGYSSGHDAIDASDFGINFCMDLQHLLLYWIVVQIVSVSFFFLIVWWMLGKRCRDKYCCGTRVLFLPMYAKIVYLLLLEKCVHIAVGIYVAYDAGVPQVGHHIDNKKRYTYYVLFSPNHKQLHHPTIFESLFLSAGFYTLSLTVRDFTVVFLNQRTAGQQALTRSAYVAAFMYVISVAMCSYGMYDKQINVIRVYFLTDSLLCLAASAYSIYQRCAGRRNMRSGAWHIYTYTIFQMVDGVVWFFSTVKHDRKYCIQDVAVWFEALYPLILFYALYTDSRMFQKIGTKFSMKRDGGTENMMESLILQSPNTYSQLQEFLSQQIEILDPMEIMSTADGEHNNTIGGGTYAVVTKTKYRGQEVAVKQLLFDELTIDSAIEFCKEALLSARFRHKNIVELVGVSIWPPTLILCYEFCHQNSLQQVLMQNNEIGSDGRQWETLGWDRRHDFATQIAEGMAYLHHQGVLHKDLKSANIFVTDQYVMKIGDFGTSQRWDQSSIEQAIREPSVTQSDYACNNIVGTPAYLPPEIIEKIHIHEFSVVEDLFGPTIMRETRSSVNDIQSESLSRKRIPGDFFKGDIWSFGCVIFEIATSTRMFEGVNSFETVQKCVLRGLRPAKMIEAVRPDIDIDEIPTDLMENMRACWMRKPRDRPRFEQLVSVFKKSHRKSDVSSDERLYSSWLSRTSTKSQRSAESPRSPRSPKGIVRLQRGEGEMKSDEHGGRNQTQSRVRFKESVGDGEYISLQPTKADLKFKGKM